MTATEKLAKKVADFSTQELVAAAKDLHRQYPDAELAPAPQRITMGAIAQELRKRYPNPFDPTA